MATNRAALSASSFQAAVQGHHGNLEVVRVDTTRWEATFRVRTGGGVSGPEFTTRLSMVRPLSDEDTDRFWKMLVDDLMLVLKEEGKCPAFVKGYDVTTGEDSTGDPALYVTILVRPEPQYSKATVSSWNAFSSLVHDRLMGLRLQRYPYIRIGEKRRSR